MAKHIFVTGGVVSSLGKGITAASLGHLLKARGYQVTMQKMDPYLNVDPRTGTKAISTWGTTSASSTRTSRASPTSRRDPSTRASSRASGAATTWAAPCR